jgi:hypothetical protein
MVSQGRLARYLLVVTSHEQLADGEDVMHGCCCCWRSRDSFLSVFSFYWSVFFFYWSVFFFRMDAASFINEAKKKIN